MKKILIVDDHLDTRYLLQSLLDPLEYELFFAENGAEAMNSVHRNRPDLIISDILMPVMDGFQLVRSIRTDHCLSSIPLIFFTATYTGPKDEEFAMKIGADAFITKPAEADLILETVKRVLDEANTERLAVEDTRSDEENEVLKLYNDRLVRKLEEKMLLAEREVEARKSAEERLRAHEKRLIMAQRMAKMGDFVWNLQNDSVQWSDPLHELLGYDPNEVIDYNLVNRQIHHPEDLEEVSLWLQDCIQKRISDFCIKEYRLLRKSGDVINVRVSIQVHCHGDVPYEVFGTVLDISDMKESEKALKASETRYRSLFRNNHAVMLIVDPADGRIVDANPAAVKFYGWTLDRIRTMKMHEINILSANEVEEEMKRASSEQRKHFQFTHRLSDGSMRDVEVFSGPITIDSKQYLYSIIHDITERRKAERALEESEIHFRTLADGGRALIWTSGVNREFDYFNRPWLEFAGKTAEEERREGWFDRVHPDDRMQLLEVYNRSFEKRERFSVDFRLKNAGNEYHWMQTDGSPRYDSRGGYLGFIGHTLDINRRRSLEAQLIQSQKMESIGRLAGGVAHDFNNILQVMMGDAELLISQLDEGNALYGLAEEITGSAKKAAALTRQLLAFARKQTMNPRVLDLNETVESMLKMLQRLIGENISLEFKPGHDLWPLYLDPGQVDQVMVNLCVNSRDAICDVGQISVETSNVTLDALYCAQYTDAVPGDYDVLTVADTGCGMDRQTVDRIFEPFYTTKEAGRGTGLGLSTVYGIVTQNHGFIHVYSEPGKGSAFRIYFPRYVAESVVELEAVDDEAVLPGKGELILVVEDEGTILELTKKILTMLNYKVKTAISAGEALRVLESLNRAPNLLMTDVIMPDMNGKELAEKVQERFPGTKVLFMSGYTADIIAHQGILENGTAFIHKPFTSAELGNKLREILNSGT